MIGDDDSLDDLDRPAGERSSERPTAPAPKKRAPAKQVEAEREPEKPAQPSLRLPVPGKDRGRPPEKGVPLSEIAREPERAERDSPPVSEAIAASPEARIPMLERQIASLRDQLAEQRKRPASGIERSHVAAALGAGLVLGIALGAIFGGRPSPAPAIIVRAERGGGEPIARPTSPGSGDTEVAWNMLRLADEALSRKQIDEALESLRACIQVGDLPECHLRAGMVLSLIGDPAARVHLERYVELSPGTANAAEIRRGLE